MVGEDIDYNIWHAFHSIDDDTDTPWHNFAKEKLRNLELDHSMILEIGCGRGGFSNYMANKYEGSSKIVACDFSTEGLKIAQNRFGTHDGVLDWKHEDIMALSFKANTFDVAISCETIEHIDNPKKAIFELYRVLKPGGLLLLTCPSYFNPFGIWCVYRWLIGKPFTEGGQPYVNYILMPKIYYFIKIAGFRIIEWHSAEIIIPARIPKHFWNERVPWLLKPLGHRTFYVLKKPFDKH